MESILNIDPRLMEEYHKRGIDTIEAIASAQVSRLMCRRLHITEAQARKIRLAARRFIKDELKFQNGSRE